MYFQQRLLLTINLAFLRLQFKPRPKPPPPPSINVRLIFSTDELLLDSEPETRHYFPETESLQDLSPWSRAISTKHAPQQDWEGVYLQNVQWDHSVHPASGFITSICFLWKPQLWWNYYRAVGKSLRLVKESRFACACPDKLWAVFAPLPPQQALNVWTDLRVFLPSFLFFLSFQALFKHYRELRFKYYVSDLGADHGNLLPHD